MKFSLCLLAILSASIAVAQNNAVPLITQPLIPDTHAATGVGFTLTVHGTRFVSGSVVNWNGSPRVTTFVSAAKLQAAITGADVSKNGTASVAVTNPGPGGGVSNVVYFPIHGPMSTLALARRDHLLTPADALGGMVTGDFNNDGKVDVVTSQAGNPEQIQVFFGNGDATFQSPVTTPLSFAVVGQMVSGDFNNDGNLDLMVVDGNGNGQVFLGDGAGSFTGQAIFNTSANSRAMAVGDFNGDGKLDLVTAGEDLGTPYLSIYLGKGDGTFTSAGDLILLNSVGTPAVGDFNRDGKLDIATPDADASFNGTVDIFLGNGDGTFQAPLTYSAVNGGSSLAAADVNGDGKLDIVTNGVTVLLGNGDGTFTSAGGVAITPNVFSLLLADMNSDGKLDVVLTGIGPVSSTVEVLLGNGNGTFQSPLIWDSGATTFLIQTGLGDFNNDGLLDVADMTYDFMTNAPQFSVFLQNILNVSPTAMNFGVVKAGNTSAPQTATLTNIGTSTIPISITLMGMNPANYTQTNNCGTSLAGGASCAITVTFIPKRKGTLVATVRVGYSGTNGPQIIEMTGLGN